MRTPANGVTLRSEDKLAGTNNIHFGDKFANYVTLPVIPAKGIAGDIASSLKSIIS